MFQWANKIIFWSVFIACSELHTDTPTHTHTHTRVALLDVKDTDTDAESMLYLTCKDH